MIALPNQDGSFRGTLFLPKNEKMSFSSPVDPAVTMKFLYDHFPDEELAYCKIANDLMTNPEGTLGTVRCDRWHLGRSVLIDDLSRNASVHGAGGQFGF